MDFDALPGWSPYSGRVLLFFLVPKCPLRFVFVQFYFGICWCILEILYSCQVFKGETLVC